MNTNLLAVDIGNTNTVAGLFKGRRLVRTWRISSSPADLARFFRRRRPKRGAVIVSSVVPALKPKGCLLVDHHLKMPLKIRIENPKEVGADRIVNAVAAYVKYGGTRPLLIIDFGTATTFDIVTGHGEYIGGIIAPGLKISAEALFERCARLPRVPLKKPSKVIGRNTIEAMQSGILLGYASMVDGMVERIKKELHSRPRVIATGGLAPVTAPLTKTPMTMDYNLTLKGLHWLYLLNRQS